MCVCNGQSLSIKYVGSFVFYSRFSSNQKLILDNIHVPSITRNLLFVSKFSSDNHVVFEFQVDKCGVKC